DAKSNEATCLTFASAGQFASPQPHSPNTLKQHEHNQAGDPRGRPATARPPRRRPTRTRPTLRPRRTDALATQPQPIRISSEAHLPQTGEPRSNITHR